MWAKAKERAADKGLPFSITIDDIVVPDICPVLGFPLVFNKDKSGYNSPTLDKIIPSKGYVPGNVAVISYRANMIKSDATALEVKQVADWLAKVTEFSHESSR